MTVAVWDDDTTHDVVNGLRDKGYRITLDDDGNYFFKNNAEKFSAIKTPFGYIARFYLKGISDTENQPDS